MCFRASPGCSGTAKCWSWNLRCRPPESSCDDPRAAALVHSLTHPGTVAEIRGRVTDLPTDAVAPLLGLLVHAGAALRG